MRQTGPAPGSIRAQYAACSPPALRPHAAGDMSGGFCCAQQLRTAAELEHNTIDAANLGCQVWMPLRNA